MFKSEDDLRKLINRLNINDKPSQAHRQKLREQMLSVFAETQKKNPSVAVTWTTLWRIIMKSHLAKFATAAAIILIVSLGIYFLGTFTIPTYAIEQSVAAVESMRYFHFKYFGSTPDSNISKEAWVEYSPNGKVKNVRFDYYVNGTITQVVTWKEGKTECWGISGKELMFFEDADYTAKILYFALRYNPKSALEHLGKLEKECKIKIEIQEPTGKQENILAKVIYEPNTYLLGREIPEMKEIYHIDNTTKLVKAVEVFESEPNGFRAIGSWEYCDYNIPFAPEILDLDKEAPSDVNRIDMMAMDIGIEQANLSDSEIAVEVVSKFLEALIHKDYALVGKLLGRELTEQQAKERFGKYNILEIISIGERNSVERGLGWRVPFKVVIEKEGERIEKQSGGVIVQRVIGHPTRWAISNTKRLY